MMNDYYFGFVMCGKCVQGRQEMYFNNITSQWPGSGTLF